MGLTARGEPGPQKGDRKGVALSNGGKEATTPINAQGRARWQRTSTDGANAMRLVAAMGTPIFVPARGETAPDHGAGDIAGTRRCAEGGGSRAAGPAARKAAHGRAADENMAGSVLPLRLAEQANEMIARRDRVGIRTGMPWTASAVHFARGDAGEADMRAFRAPDRAIAIPDRDGRADEGLTGRNDRGEQKQAEHRPSLTRTTHPFKCITRRKVSKSRAKRPKKDALLARPRPDGVRAGLWASRRPARTPSQVRCAAQNNARPLAPLAGARARPIQPRSIWPRHQRQVQPL